MTQPQIANPEIGAAKPAPLEATSRPAPAALVPGSIPVAAAARSEGDGANARSALRCHNVSVTIGSTSILNNVSLTVARGEWVTIIGPNGAGKSTLFRAVAGLIGYRGDIEVFGRSTAETSARERATELAVVPQIQTVPAGMRTLDYVLLGRHPWISPLGRESAADLALAYEALDQLDAAHLHNRYVESLSGGERQRVIVARALAQQAPLLLLDEPTTSLDIGHQQELLELLARLRSSANLTLVTTMHDLTLSGQYADRLILLSGGEVVADDEPSAVLSADLIASYYRASVDVVTGADGALFVVPTRPRGAAASIPTGNRDDRQDSA